MKNKSIVSFYKKIDKKIKLGDNINIEVTSVKKKFLLVIVLFLSFLVIGCKEEKVITKCSSVNDQPLIGYKITSNYTIYSLNDIVSKVKMKQVITSTDNGILENFKNNYENQYKLSNSLYGGYDYDIKSSNNKLTVTLIINYDKTDLDKFIMNNEAMEQFLNKDNKLTLNGALKMYESSGMKCE